MTDRQVKCLRCEVAMEEGYLADHGHHNSTRVANWVSDEPDMHWYGLKKKGHEQIPLAAYRCPKCGYVEFRAFLAEEA